MGLGSASRTVLRGAAERKSVQTSTPRSCRPLGLLLRPAAVLVVHADEGGEGRHIVCEYLVLSLYFCRLWDRGVTHVCVWPTMSGVAAPTKLTTRAPSRSMLLT